MTIQERITKFQQQQKQIAQDINKPQTTYIQLDGAIAVLKDLEKQEVSTETSEAAD